MESRALMSKINQKFNKEEFFSFSKKNSMKPFSSVDVSWIKGLTFKGRGARRQKYIVSQNSLINEVCLFAYHFFIVFGFSDYPKKKKTKKKEPGHVLTKDLAA